MKKLYLILSIFICFGAKSQISDTNILRGYINANIIPNGTRQITATQLNIILKGVMNKKVQGFDTVYRVNNSTIGYKIKGVVRTLIIKGGASTGGSGGSGGGISRVRAGYGLQVVNDSTTKVDSLVFLTVDRFLNTLH